MELDDPPEWPVTAQPEQPPRRPKPHPPRIFRENPNYPRGTSTSTTARRRAHGADTVRTSCSCARSLYRKCSSGSPVGRAAETSPGATWPCAAGAAPGTTYSAAHMGRPGFSQLSGPSCRLSWRACFTALKHSPPPAAGNGDLHPLRYATCAICHQAVWRGRIRFVGQRRYVHSQCLHNLRVVVNRGLDELAEPDTPGPPPWQSAGGNTGEPTGSPTAGPLPSLQGTGAHPSGDHQEPGGLAGTQVPAEAVAPQAAALPPPVMGPLWATCVICRQVMDPRVPAAATPGGDLVHLHCYRGIPVGPPWRDLNREGPGVGGNAGPQPQPQHQQAEPEPQPLPRAAPRGFGTNGPTCLARYSGTCPACGRPILPGDALIKPTGRWVHLLCGDR